MSAVRTIRVQDLIGRQAVALNGRRIGRIEELRVEPGRGTFELMEVLIGTGGLLERLSVIRPRLTRRSRALVARWDQIDLSDPMHPKLTCGVDELIVKSPPPPSP